MGAHGADAGASSSTAASTGTPGTATGRHSPHMSHALLGLLCEKDCWAVTTYMNCALVPMAQRCDVLDVPS